MHNTSRLPKGKRMAEDQAAGPAKDNPPAGGTPAKDASALTGSTTSTTSSLTTGATPELPHAWMTGLTTEQKADADLVKSLSKFEKGIPDLAKSYAELEKKVGQAIVFPGEKASPEEMARFRKQVGVPEKSDDYKLEKISLPNGLEINGQETKELLALAHKLNISQGQLSAVYNWFGENLKAETQALMGSAEEATRVLRKRWGSEFDANTTLKMRLVNKMPPVLVAKIDRVGLGNDPDFIDWVTAQSKAMGEHFFAEGSRGERLETAPVGKRNEQQLAGVLYPVK